MFMIVVQTPGSIISIPYNINTNTVLKEWNETACLGAIKCP